MTQDFSPNFISYRVVVEYDPTKLGKTFIALPGIPPQGMTITLPESDEHPELSDKIFQVLSTQLQCTFARESHDQDTLILVNEPIVIVTDITDDAEDDDYPYHAYDEEDETYEEYMS